MRTVKIKKEYCDSSTEEDIIYEVLEDNGDRLHVRALNSVLSLPPIEVVKREWILLMAKIKLIMRKSNHYNFVGDEKYDVREEMIEGETEREICEKFYFKNRRCDMSFYHEFIDKEWTLKMDRWYDSLSESERKNLYYKDSIVD